jgi:cytochrome b561
MKTLWQTGLSFLLLIGASTPAWATDNLDYVQTLGIRYGVPVLVLLVIFLITSSLLLRYNSPAQWKNWTATLLQICTAILLLAVLVVAVFVSFHTEQPLPALAFAFFLCLPFLVAGWFTLQSLMEVRHSLREASRPPAKEPSSL